MRSRSSDGQEETANKEAGASARSHLNRTEGWQPKGKAARNTFRAALFPFGLETVRFQLNRTTSRFCQHGIPLPFRSGRR